jgi:hypothetical protein
MRYFSFFPKLTTTDKTGNAVLSTNILTRVNVIPELLSNPSSYYTYEIQDGDTPETIAAKYYGNPYRYWIFMFGNGDKLLDPQWDMPLSYRLFDAYLKDKYASAANTASQTVLAYTQSTISRYFKVVTTVDSNSNQTTVNRYVVDYDTYITLPENVVTTKYFSDGNFVEVTTSRSTQTIFEYEQELNEEKRTVNIVDARYASELEEKLKSLLTE